MPEIYTFGPKHRENIEKVSIAPAGSVAPTLFNARIIIINITLKYVLKPYVYNQFGS